RRDSGRAGLPGTERLRRVLILTDSFKTALARRSSLLHMQPRIHVLTLAVADLEQALRFYRDGLGLESQGIVGTEYAGDDVNPAGAIAMFQLQGGLILTLYPRTELAK